MNFHYFSAYQSLIGSEGLEIANLIQPDILIASRSNRIRNEIKTDKEDMGGSY